jgi:hypothetical protein
VGDLVGGAAQSTAGVEVDAVEGFEALREAVLAGDVGAQPAVELVADADARERARAEVLVVELRRGQVGARELAIAVVADPASPRRYQPPKSSAGAATGAYWGCGGAMRSAADAENADAARRPAKVMVLSLSMSGPLL